MKVTQVEFSRLYNLGNFEHKKVGLTIVLEGEETPAQALIRAEKFIEGFLIKDKITEYAYEKAKKVLQDPDAHTGIQVKEAQRIVDTKEIEADIPF